jgi:hypothetical protein
MFAMHFCFRTAKAFFSNIQFSDFEMQLPPPPQNKGGAECVISQYLSGLPAINSMGSKPEIVHIKIVQKSCSSDIFCYSKFSLF